MAMCGRERQMVEWPCKSSAAFASPPSSVQAPATRRRLRKVRRPRSVARRLPARMRADLRRQGTQHGDQHRVGLQVIEDELVDCSGWCARIRHVVPTARAQVERRRAADGERDVIRGAPGSSGMSGESRACRGHRASHRRKNAPAPVRPPSRAPSDGAVVLIEQPASRNTLDCRRRTLRNH